MGSRPASERNGNRQRPHFVLEMRYLIDTNIAIYIMGDPDSLDKDVKALISDSDSLLYISAESAKELVIAYRNKGLLAKKWKTPEDVLYSLENEYFIQILPVKREHIVTYARLRINVQQDHKDPSDHVIIAHAITEHLPLISSDTRFDFYRRQGLDLIFNKK